MVVINKCPTTTYYHSFQAVPKHDIAKTYVNSSDYRLERRLNECAHSSESFVWDQPEWDVDSEHSICIPIRNSLPTHQYKHLKFNRAYNKESNTANIKALNQLNLSTAALDNGKINVVDVGTNTIWSSMYTNRTTPCSMCHRTLAVQTVDLTESSLVCAPSLSSIHSGYLIHYFTGDNFVS